MESLICLVFLISSALSASLHSVASPDTGCFLTLSSGHHNMLKAQRDRSPYKTLILQKMEVALGNPVEIMLSAPIGGPSFVGFIVQVHAVTGSDQGPVGRFNPGSDEHAVAMDCQGKVNSVMTHKDLEPKVHVKLEWIPPKEGEYVPVVTWFKTEDTFWLSEKPAAGKTIKIVSRTTSSHHPPLFRKSDYAPSIDEFLGQRVTISSADRKVTVNYNMGNVVFHFVILCLGTFGGVMGSFLYWFSIERKTAKVIRRFQMQNQVV